MIDKLKFKVVNFGFGQISMDLNKQVDDKKKSLSPIIINYNIKDEFVLNPVLNWYKILWNKKEFKTHSSRRCDPVLPKLKQVNTTIRC